MTDVMWFRRDLRLGDHPALLEAAAGGDVLGVFVLDPVLAASGGRRTRRLLAALRDLQHRTGHAIVVRTGDPRDVVPAVAAESGAGRVLVSRESTPYGRRRDRAVGRALQRAGRELVAAGSPYAVGPGRVLTGSGTPYKVFTPFSRAWRDHGWPPPAPQPEVGWVRGIASERPDLPDDVAGEPAALRRWAEFLDNGLAGYATRRDIPGIDGTSRMSVALKYGEVHPRTLLHDLAARADDDARTLMTELCWREFYADVLWHHPRSARADLTDALAGMPYADPADPGVGGRIGAWKSGRTGYPIVDAGMRQLAATGWMHNRVRMIAASFLIKDLHVWWPVGAAHFMDLLDDGDIASNSHGWQWVAGTGTDAAPYFRVFNPVLQGKKFDPDGGYLRRFVPELAHLDGAAAHEPWRHDDGYAHGYPQRIVDHAEERREALARYDAARRQHLPSAARS